LSFLQDTLIFFTAAVVMVPIFRRLGLGAVLGYLAAGVAIGPWGLRLIDEVDSILGFSMIGVVLLLFVLGLELKPSRLWAMRRLVFGLGSLQVLVTTVLLGALGWWWLGDPLWAGLIAVALALSGTALSLQMLAERNQVNTRLGRSAFSILLFQDLISIPLLVLVPLLAPAAPELSDQGGVLLPLAEGIGVVLLVVVGGHYLLKPYFRVVAAARMREIFIAAALLVVLGVALVMDVFGLSMALGAFLAGVLLADSQYRHQLVADIDPFKGLLLGLFFIAVGMSLDFGQIVDRPGETLAVVAVMCLVKVAVLIAVGRFSGLNRADSTGLGFAVFQGGEFTLVLLALAVDHAVLPVPLVDQLLVAAILSMVLTPFLFRLQEVWLQPRLQEAKLERPYDDIRPAEEPRVIIAGFGRVGQIVARNLAMLRIPFTALDIDSEHVEFVARFGSRIHFGDATNTALLDAAGARQADVFVLAIGDLETSLRLARLVRGEYPHLKLFARAHNRSHALKLMESGAQYVIRETLLSSLDMARAVLETLDVRAPRNVVEIFRLHDEKTLLEQRGARGNFEEIARIGLRSRKELEALFDKDRSLAEGGTGIEDRGR
jgi:monovalent cation:proton antiporter-2 (CPA2) family protein